MHSSADDRVRLVDVGQVLSVLEGGDQLTISQITAAAHVPEGEVCKIVDQLTQEDLVRPVGAMFVRHRR